VFDGDVEESNRSPADEKFRRRDEVVGRQSDNGDKHKIGGNYNRVACRDEYVRWSDRPDRSALGCACGLTAQIGGLACSRFDPGQESVIFVHAVKVDQGLASHLVRPDPVVSDQLVSLSLSELAIAATVFELDEPAPLVVIIINHGSCTWYDNRRGVGSSRAEREGHLHSVTLVSTRAYEQCAAFVGADEVSVDLFRLHLRAAQLLGMRRLYRLRGQTKGWPMPH
jgi:hypothetical protein